MITVEEAKFVAPMNAEAGLYVLLSYVGSRDLVALKVEAHKQATKFGYKKDGRTDWGFPSRIDASRYVPVLHYTQAIWFFDKI